MNKYCYTHPRPAVTVDIVCLSRKNNVWRVLLIKRARKPFKDCWALPGGFVEIDEDIEDAARRELREETALVPKFIEQFRCFGKPGRDPRGRTISIAFIAIFDKNSIDKTQPGDDAKQAEWFDVDKLPELAFDHKEIIEKAMQTLDQWRRLGIIEEESYE